MPDAAAILREHGTMVWRTLHRLAGTPVAPTEIEDCFQEVFVAAIEFNRRQPVRNWQAMLRRIATTKGLDLVRSRIRGRERFEELELAAVPGREVEPITAMQGKELADTLRRALTKLKPLEAEIFCLKHLEDWTYEEIATESGMTPGAVGVMIHRTREKLRDLMIKPTESAGGVGGEIESLGKQRSEVFHG